MRWDGTGWCYAKQFPRRIFAVKNGRAREIGSTGIWSAMAQSGALTRCKVAPSI